MDLSIFLAKVIGLYFIIAAFLVLIKNKELNKMVDCFFNDNVAIKYISGFMILILGLMMVVSHNVWENSWRVIITLIGWLILLKALGFFFIPQKIMIKFSKVFLKNKNRYFIIAIIMALIGIYLVSKGFSCCL